MVATWLDTLLVAGCLGASPPSTPTAIEVVDATTGDPIADSEVWCAWADGLSIADEPPWGGLDPPAWIEKSGTRLALDSGQHVTLPERDPSQAEAGADAPTGRLVPAREGDRFDFVVIHRVLPSRLRFALQPRRSIGVRVIDAAGEPVADVPSPMATGCCGGSKPTGTRRIGRR
jgi:hypothetical protein